MNTTRKEFIAALTAAGISTAFGVDKKKKDEFQDIRVDRYYILRGGQFKETGGIGCPGVELGIGTVKEMDLQKCCNMLDRWIDNIEDKGFYLEVSGYFEPDNAKQFGKIQLKRDWLLKFYNLHKNETKQDWEDKYNKYLDSLRK